MGPLSNRTASMWFQEQDSYQVPAHIQGADDPAKSYFVLGLNPP